MISAIIVDDEQHNIENLKTLLAKNCSKVIVVGEADNVNSANELINAVKADIVFLDIQMGEETGFDLLTRLPNRNFEVIFVTAYSEHGIRAIKFAALDYILKPVDVNELKAAVQKAEEKISQRKKNTQLDFLMEYVQKKESQPAKIALPQQNEIRYIDIANIVRCEANNTYTWFHLDDKEKILVSKPLKEYDELLGQYGFVRCHQTHLINPRFIKSLSKTDGGILLLQNGEKIPVSKSKKEIVKLALAKAR